MLWAVDAAYILCAAVNPALKLQVAGKKVVLPYALGWVLYANVCGRALASVKNWWLERGVLTFAHSRRLSAPSLSLSHDVSLPLSLPAVVCRHTWSATHRHSGHHTASNCQHYT